MSAAVARLNWHVDRMGMAYVPQAVVHHHPSSSRDTQRRRRLIVRTGLWCTWLRRPFSSAMRETGRLLREASEQRTLARVVPEALRGLPWVVTRASGDSASRGSSAAPMNEFYDREARPVAQRTRGRPESFSCGLVHRDEAAMATQ